MEEVTLPVFQEAARCAVCSSTFSTFKRRHHCRRCGKSLCNEHSSNQMALPQFGIKSPVRVCDDCFQGSNKIPNGHATSEVNSTEAKVSDSFAKLNVSSPNSSPPREEVGASAAPEAQVHECTCGMPLCICQISMTTEAMPSAQVLTPPIVSKKSSTVASGASAGVKRNTPTKSCYGNELPSLFFSSAKSASEGLSKVKKYEQTGEGLWEAVKNGDAAAVKDLLANGVDPNHRDKQGMSLLHLAAVFNFTEITFLLMDAGAQAGAKNGQGETPLDCAPATLQFKMQQKLKAMQ